MPIYLTTPYPMLYICSVMTRKGDSRTQHATSLHVAGFGDASVRRLYMGGGIRGHTMACPYNKQQTQNF